MTDISIIILVGKEKIHMRRWMEKEASETRYWIELLRDSGYLANAPTTDSLHSDCTELIRILVASTKTVQGK